MAPLDWLVILGYFAVLAAVVVLTRRRQDTSEDFFLGGRSVGWLAIGASIFAANIGSEHVIGLAGQGARTGLSMAHWEFHAWVLVLMAWVFLPFYYTSGVQTMPEFLERRFGARARWILSLVSLAAYVLTKISVTVFAGALFFEVMLPELSLNIAGHTVSSFWIGAFTTVTLAGVYASFGGLLAVVYTDLVQTGIILTGSLSVTFFALTKLGGTLPQGGVLDGWGVLKATLKDSPAVVDAFSLWHPLSHPTLPWLGVVVASVTVGVWYWCTDQFIIQRTLSARNLTHARRGALWGGFLKLTPVFIFLIPGMLGYALHQHGIIQIPLDSAGAVDGDKVFPTLVTALLPAGFRGLVVAGLVA
ncbi:MAG: sodium/solute symporter, partial [Lentisphaerae bacterium]|nr:sodium/solute symporter [Lentisphaerota bacterium]